MELSSHDVSNDFKQSHEPGSRNWRRPQIRTVSKRVTCSQDSRSCTLDHFIHFLHLLSSKTPASIGPEIQPRLQNLANLNRAASSISTIGCSTERRTPSAVNHVTLTSQFDSKLQVPLRPANGDCNRNPHLARKRTCAFRLDQSRLAICSLVRRLCNKSTYHATMGASESKKNVQALTWCLRPKLNHKPTLRELRTYSFSLRSLSFNPPPLPKIPTQVVGPSLGNRENFGTSQQGGNAGSIGFARK